MATQTDVNQRRDKRSGANRAENAAEDEGIDHDELAGLAAVANLDLEAALVYELVADSVDDPELEKMLRAFGEDHRRHVTNIEELLRELGARVEERLERSGGILVGLAATLGALDQDAAIEALIANEQLTNSTYETAQFVVVTFEAADEVLKANAADEQRHLEALLDYQRERDGDGEEDD